MRRLSSTPRLLIELEPAHKVFARNLKDSLFPNRQPALLISSRPGVFWHDVFVASRPPWQIFAKSMLAQAVLGLGLLVSFKFTPPPHVLERSPFRDTAVIYFKASEYLPPIDTVVKESSVTPQQGSPQPSKQTIISVPPEADNRTQTVVTAPALRLSHPVPLPNMVSWAPKPPVIPAAMTEREISGLKARTLNPSAIAAPVTGPAPEISKTMREPSSLLPASAVVAPAPEMNRISERKPAEALATETNVVAPTPLLNTSERSPRARLAAAEGNSVAPPAPSLSGPHDQARKLIVLNASPVPPPAEDKVQIGNRRGTFAATPQGNSGSPGSPSTAGRGEISNSSTTDSRSDIPAGLLVGTAPKADSPSAKKDQAVVAEVIPPRVTSMPQESASAISGRNTGQVEKTIFGDRRFYSMTMNMPNLNSAGGSWVIRFAELKENQKTGALVAPIATQEVDPGYPAELMRHNISGTVTLYAVIRRDGSVGEVRILVSADDRLDEYARNALLRWRFQPATKNGNAVDLEAIVIIPFKPARMKSAF
jgi:TonB family protein